MLYRCCIELYRIYIESKFNVYVYFGACTIHVKPFPLSDGTHNETNESDSSIYFEENVFYY